MTSSIERDVENAIAYALTAAGVTGVNIYTSERTSGRLLPFVSIVASIKSEEIAPFTGVFDLNCTITYVARADTISDQAYDQKFASIQQAFYTDPNLASQMTSTQFDLEFYIADITRVGQRIISTSRTWARDIFMDVKVTSNPAVLPNPSLLLHMDGSNGSTNFIDNSLNNFTVTPYGNVQISDTEKKFGTGAGYFNGSDYLTIDPNSNFNLRNMDYTVEFWVNMTSWYAQSDNPRLISFENAGGSYGILADTANPDLTFVYNHYGFSEAIASSIAPTGWNHIALVQQGSTTNLYLNGVNQGSIAIPTMPDPNDGDVKITIGGSTVNYSYQEFYGYIDELRIINGYAAYTSNFTPANQPFPNPPISILLHMDGSNGSTNFIDSSLNNLTITPYGAAQISTSEYRFGGASGYFNRQDDSYLEIENIELFEFGANDFTLECWIYPIEENGIGGGTCIARWGGSNNAFFFQARTDEGIGAYLNDTFIPEVFGGTILADTWSHICLTRSNGQLRGFINGELIGTAQFTESITESNVALRIGGDVYGNIRFNGYIDEVRILNNYAAYTSNFTPPNQPFPNP